MEQLRGFLGRVKDRVLRPQPRPEPYIEPTLTTNPPLSQTADLVIRAIDIEVVTIGGNADRGYRGGEHLLAALAPNEITRSAEYELAKGPALVLSHFGITKDLVRRLIGSVISAHPMSKEYQQTAMEYFEGVRLIGVETLHTTPSLRRVLNLAETLAKNRGSERVDSLDLLGGLLRYEEGFGLGFLVELQVDTQLMQEAVEAARSRETWEDFVSRVPATLPPKAVIDKYLQIVSRKDF